MLANVSADFSQLPWVDGGGNPSNDNPNLGDVALAHPFDPIPGPPPPGIHLHWALPAAITGGSAHRLTGKVDFPHAPNRWLVVRAASFATGPDAVGAWVIESDQLWDVEATLPESDPNNPAGTVPVDAAAGEPAYRTMGRVYALTDWTGQDPGAAYASKLTAVGYGTIEYAAAYPHCPSVFGFFDPAEDLDAAGSGPTGIGFVVLGWYTEAANDPLHPYAQPSETKPSDRRAEIAQVLGWELDLPDDSPIVPARTVLSGMLTGVPWDGTARIQPRAASGLQIAIGNTTAEAVAALLAGGEQGDESLLNLFQLGLLSRQNPSQPSDPDAAASAEEKEHAARFGARPAGTVWRLRRLAAEPQPGTDPTLAAAGAVFPPPAAAPLLSTLNIAQASLDGAGHDLAARRSQLFADWYRFMRLQYSQMQSPTLATDAANVYGLINEHVLADIDAAAAAAAKQADAVALAKQALDAALTLDNGGWISDATPAPTYRHANDLVLLLSGADLHPSDHYAAAQGPVRCRLAADIIASLTLTDAGGPHTVGADRLPSLPANSGPIPAESAALFTEALLLDPHQAPALATILVAEGAVGDAATLAGAITAAQTALLSGGATDPVTFAGGAPDPLAVTGWEQPWIPLLLDWRVTVDPVATLDPAGSYPSDLLTANYEAVSDTLDLEPVNPTPSTTPQVFDGTIVLAARTAVNLQTQLQKYLQVNPNAPNKDRLEALSATLDPDAMAQALNGFTPEMLMREQTLQIPIGDPLAGAGLGTDEDVPASFSDTDVHDRVGGANDQAPVPGGGFNPVRGGLLRIDRLRVIDAFGQTCRIDDFDPPVVSASLQGEVGVAAGSALLPARLSQPARLLLRWRSGIDDTVVSNTCPETTPVCGWFVYNHLDDSLAVYDAVGLPLGSVEVPAASTDRPQWQGAPGTSAFGQGVQDAVANLHLRAAVAALCDPNCDPLYLAALLATIDLALTTINPLAHDQDQPLSVLTGRPLAVVRATLRLELQGSPAADQSWEALAQTVAKPLQRPAGAIERVRVPVTLGDPGKLGDGLVGYWVDDGSSGAYSTFHAPAPSGGHGVVDADPGATALTPRGSADATADLALTTLLDPLGSVHATSGILPTEAIALAPELYRDALNQIAVTFFTGPVLAPGAAPDAPPPLPVPAKAGFNWSWLSRTGTAWSEQAVDEAATPKAGLVSPQHAEEGWLRLARRVAQNADRRS